MHRQSLFGGAIRFSCLAICVLALTARATPAGAVGEPVNGFPNWAERVIHEWINRARVDPQFEMNACGSNCVERACYSAMPPLTWNEDLNRSARFHSDELVRQGYFAHDSACTVVSNIDSIYPTSCNGAATCACVGGTKACSPTCTAWWQRVELFGGSPSGEIIASPSDPNQAFYLWLFEPGDTTSCQFTGANGHRWLILTSTGAVGTGVSGYSTGDFGSGTAPTKIPSGSHYPQQAASVAMWANWYDTAGPSAAAVNVDGACTAMTLQHGTATNGAWSATVTGAGSGCHRYYFSFRDAGGTTVTYPTTGSLAIGSGTGCPDWASTQPAACAVGTVPPSTSTPTSTPLPSPSATASRSATATQTASRTATATATPIPPSPSSTPTPTLSGLSVSGYIHYYSNGAPVSGIAVHAADPAMVSSSGSTDSIGHYVLDNVPTDNVALAAQGTGGVGNAISALDASYALQAVASLRTLSAEQALACDVTGNGSVSALDATFILKYAAGLITSFPVTTACGSDWVFIPNPAPAASQSLVQPQPGAANCIPGAIDFGAITTSLDEQDFSALVFGDCTGNWHPAAGASALRAAAASAPATAGVRWRSLSAHRMALTVAGYGTDPIYALDLQVTYDPAALRVANARLVGRARHAALAVNDRDAGTLHVVVASGAGIRVGVAPLVFVRFDAHDRGVASPAVSVRINDE